MARFGSAKLSIAARCAPLPPNLFAIPISRWLIGRDGNQVKENTKLATRKLDLEARRALGLRSSACRGMGLPLDVESAVVFAERVTDPAQRLRRSRGAVERQPAHGADQAEQLAQGHLPRWDPRWSRNRPSALRRHRTGLACRVSPRAASPSRVVIDPRRHLGTPPIDWIDARTQNGQQCHAGS